LIAVNRRLLEESLQRLRSERTRRETEQHS
jgi:hypothetical protein